MKILKGLILFALIFCGIGYGAWHFFFTMAVPSYKGVEHINGLSAEVTVKTDEFGIPHIFAQNETDLFFAQGYITARERLFQMDMTRMAGRGELSSVFGKRTLESDKFLKTVGFYRQAKKCFSVLSDDGKDILEAYAAGVNAYINTCDHLPREYVFLRTEPLAWVPEDSVVAILLMSYSLTRSKKVDLIMNLIRAQAGDDVLRAILPSYPKFAPVLVADDRRSGTVNEFVPKIGDAVTRNTGFKGFPLTLDIAASNWMIFSPKLTGTGKPMFAGSPDLSPTLPGLFYLTRMKGGSFDAMGGALPGVPGIGPLGFNGSMAWSAVNGRGDELDYFVEKINPTNPNQYLTENGYEDFKVIKETLRIKEKDGTKEVPFEVKISRHGPMISKVMELAPENCSMEWAALDIVARDFDGLMAMARSTDFASFRKALSLVRTMNLNIGYADIHGNIGWQFTASPPIREKGDGSLPVPGWTGEYDWKGFIPFEDLPWDKNPAKGYVASFNNDPGNVDYHLTRYYLFERAIRFENLMKERGNGHVDFQELKSMQLDTVSVVAQRWVPRILEACRGMGELSAYLDLLDGWDGTVDLDSRAAVVFNYFYFRMMKNTFMDEVGQERWDKGLAREYLYYVPDLALTRIMDDNNHKMFDDKSTPMETENRDDIIRKSLKQTADYIAQNLGGANGKWNWGKVHQMYFKHPLGEKLFFLNLDPVPTPGSHHTINSGFWTPLDPFRMTSGGVIRMMVDFNDLESATIISPPGQSGHYKSPHYDDLVHTWAKGDQIPMHFSIGQTLGRTLTLQPKP
ncbi:MAG: penicillin acylase family protein [Desulfobacterales bacterium]|nr:penicillin acylase family protein [Desulfobacterales bacterium]